MNAPENQGRFNLSLWALRHRPLVVFVVLVASLAGILSYTRLPQSEDPAFTLRVMVVETLWPGATAHQVKELVSDKISRTLQETPSIDYLRADSRNGRSTLFFAMKDSVPASEIRETWYQVRKKIGDIRPRLPPNILGPYFNDEFSDVYTNLYVLDGDGLSSAQLRDYADTVRTALLHVPGVGKIDYFGDPDEHVYVEIPNARLAQLGIPPAQIGAALSAQNAVTPAGVIQTPSDRVHVQVSGQFDTAQAITDTFIRTGSGMVRIGDIATVRRSDDDPPVAQVRFGGNAVLCIGVTMQPDGDVISLGHALGKEIAALRANLPAGVRLIEVQSMPHAVADSINEFVRSVAEAVAIVLLVSLASLGVRAGMVVAVSIPVVLAITALLMYLFGIGLHKVSLGTLVLALGLLVDDAIIAIETMAVKLQQGWDKVSAAAFTYTNTAFPMLSGTLITVAGFLPIVLAKSGTGEYTRSIFQVSAISLIVSWFAAVMLIPLLGSRMLAARPAQNHAATVAQHDVYSTRFYRRLRETIDLCIRQRWIVLLLTVGLFMLSLAGFALVPQQFFPTSDRLELLIDLRLAQNASFDATLAEVKRLEKILAPRPEIAHAINFVGFGAPRFYLPLDQQLPQLNFAQFVVTTKSIQAREQLAQWLDTALAAEFPAVRTRVSRLDSGPPVGYPVQFRVSGDELPMVRSIAAQVAAVLREAPLTRDVQLDSDEPSARSLRFEINQAAARRLGVTSEDVAGFLAMTLSGYPVTQYRKGDRLISIELRSPQGESNDPAAVEQITIPTPYGPVPLGALGHVRYALEDGIVRERDGKSTVTVQSDVRHGAQGIDVAQDIDRRLGKLRSTLPEGYRIDIGGAAEESMKAQASIQAEVPVMVIAILTLLMIQLQSFARVIMVVLTAPLGLIGVVAALLLLGKPFGFAAMLGVIAMFGIIMRNSVILVDQIERDIAAGQPRWDAIAGATVRRFRPIVLTAAAAVLALIPLLRSNFFGSMACALMGGITGATVLTVFFLPALYAAAFRVRADERAIPEPRSGGASS